MMDQNFEPSLTSHRVSRLSSHTPLIGQIGVGGGSPVAGAAGSPASGVNLSIGGHQRRFDEDVSLPLIKVVVLGAPGVGKTSVVKRFVSNDFTDEHRTTRKKVEHFPSLILNESLFELKLIDLPVIPFFPPDNLSEWTDYRFYGLRSASAYLLVYDVSIPSSFHFVKAIREQMYESRDMTNIPVIVVANKMDLVATTKNQQQRLNHSNASSQLPASNAITNASATINAHHHMDSNGHANGVDRSALNLTAASNLAAVGPSGDAKTAGLLSAVSATDVSYDRKEINHLVRKTWRSAHVECSAKFNWNIVTVFRELAVTLDMVANGQDIGSSNNSVRKRRCLVF